MMPSNNAKGFQALELKGSEILSLVIEPRGKVSLEISQFDVTANVARICELQFGCPLHFGVKLEGKPWFKEIIDQRVYRESSYLLERAVKNEKRTSEKNAFCHYAIGLKDGGAMDIVARSFAFLVKKEIPRAKIVR